MRRAPYRSFLLLLQLLVAELFDLFARFDGFRHRLFELAVDEAMVRPACDSLGLRRQLQRKAFFVSAPSAAI